MAAQAAAWEYQHAGPYIASQLGAVSTDKRCGNTGWKSNHLDKNIGKASKVVYFFSLVTEVWVNPPEGTPLSSREDIKHPRREKPPTGLMSSWQVTQERKRLSQTWGGEDDDDEFAMSNTTFTLPARKSGSKNKRGFTLFVFRLMHLAALWALTLVGS